MSATGRPDCRTPGGHGSHICQLKKAGKAEEISARTSAPGYACHNCNAVANRADDLCNPSPLPKRS